MAKNSTLNVLGSMIVLASVVSGCGTKVEEVKVSTKPVDKPELVLPEADTLSMRDVEWVIITPENINKVFEDLQKTNGTVVLFAVTEKGYENIALNANDLRTFIQQQNAIILAYRNYYIRSQQALDGAVKITR